MNINVTTGAKEQLERVIKDSDYKNPALRIVYAGAGWGGPRLGLALDESENTNDFLLKENDINIILDKNIKLMLDNGKSITIDYHESRYGSGFTIDSGCSC